MCVQVVYHSHQELNRFKPHKKYYWLFSLPWSRRGELGALKDRYVASPLEKPARLVGAGVAWSMDGDLHGRPRPVHYS